VPYSADAYFALFSDYNQAIRRVPALALFLAAGVIALATRSRQNRGRIILAFLAAGWAWTGLVWHFAFFDVLNFAAPAYGVLFVLQALLLLWIGVYRRQIAIGFDGSPTHWLGAMIMGVSIFFLPLIDWISGTSWTETRFALITPGTTASLTAGVLLLSAERARYALLVVPLFWLAGSGLHAWALDIPRDYLLSAAGAIELVSCIVFRETRGRRTP